MIWIIGSRGMLGRELCALCEERGVPFIGSDMDVSILDPQALKNFAEKHNPSWIVNCAAYTAVDRAESDVDAAFAINRDGTANIAATAAERKIPLIHISTDYVFSGTSSQPLDEEAPAGPVGVYGKSKLAGELEVRKRCRRYFIIRTAWLYGRYGKNFVFTMLKLMNSKDDVKVVQDQIGSPTSAADLAALIVHIIKNEFESWGVYHFSNEGSCSWYQFASEIYRIGQKLGLITSDCRVIPCGSDQYPTPAKRPAYSLLSKEKVKNNLLFNVPEWQESLGALLETLEINNIQ